MTSRADVTVRLLAAAFGVWGMTEVGLAQANQGEIRIHNRGELWETVRSNGTVGAPNPTSQYEFYPSMDWPGGPATLSGKDEQRSYHAGGGLWIGGKRTNGQVFFLEHGPFANVDNGTFDPISKVTNYTGTEGFNPAEAEEVITASWTTTEKLRVIRTSRAWSFREYRTVIFYDFLVTNLGTASVQDVYIGFPYLLRPSYQDFVAHNGWGDDFNRTDDKVKYDPSLRILYSYDQTPNSSLPNDVGNYWDAAGELRTTGYVGIALLYADSASDLRPQPSNLLAAQLLNNERYLSLATNSAENLYNILSGVDTTLRTKPDSLLSPFTLMACGPYTIPVGDTVRIVLAAAVNGLPIDRAIVPPAQVAATQTLLPKGLDSLRASVSRAQRLFARNYTPGAIPPPSPPIEIVALPTERTIFISWPPIERTYRNPLTGRPDVRSFRVYRSDRSYLGPFSRIREIRPGTIDTSLYFNKESQRWEFRDPSINVGTGYFYAVTTLDSAGRQESWLTNRNETPLRALAAPAPNTLNVKVFPNPFREKSGFPTTGEEKTIVFNNLPPRCTIRIFTASGEVIKTIEHNNPTAGTAVWDQLTDARQRTASGIYFYTVESDVGSARGTLLIIK